MHLDKKLWDTPSQKSSKTKYILHIALASLLAVLPIRVNAINNNKDTMFGTEVYAGETWLSDTTFVWEKQDNQDNENTESIEVQNERMFKSAVATALRNINSLKDIPAGWIPLHYPNGYVGNLPKTIDFFPKEIKATNLASSLITIGNRMFLITPDLWFFIEKMYMDSLGFHSVVKRPWFFFDMTKTVSKNKTTELPDYLRRLYTEGESGYYLFSTVKEIPEAQQIYYKKVLDNANK